jgi:hypothetical protein
LLLLLVLLLLQLVLLLLLLLLLPAVVVVVVVVVFVVVVVVVVALGWSFPSHSLPPIGHMFVSQSGQSGHIFRKLSICYEFQIMYSRCLEFHTFFVGCVSTVRLRVSYA